jgi:protein TonB
MRMLPRLVPFALLFACLPASALQCEVVWPPAPAGDPAQVREIEQLLREQAALLDQLRAQVAQMPASAQRAARERQLAEVEKRLAGQALECPVSEPPAAAWAKEVVARIEECGTRNFPAVAGRRHHGVATARFSVGRHGELLSSAVIRPSGDKAVDAQVLRVIEASAPFGEVPVPMRVADEFVFIERFDFAHEARASAAAQPERRCRLGNS